MSQSEPLVRAHVNTIRRHWMAGLVSAAIVLAVLVPISMGLPNLYRASASLIVDQASDPLAQRDAQVLELSGRLQAYRQEALSRQRVLALADELDLYPAARAAGEQDAIVQTMQRDVKVDPTSSPRGDGRMTTISFRIMYTGTDPHKVADVANRLARFYVDRNDDVALRVASRAAEQLKQDLDSIQKQLEAQDNRVIDFTRQNAASLPATLAAQQSKYAQLTQQHQTNATEITRMRDRRETIQNQIANLSAPSASVDSSDPAIRLARAERELKDLINTYTESSLQVRNKQNEIDGLRKEVAARNGSGGAGSADTSLLATLKTQLSELESRISSSVKDNEGIRAEMDRYDAQMMNAPIRNAEFERLSREANQTRQRYDSTYARYQTALLGERAKQGNGTTEFQVLDPAMPPEAPSAPDRQLLLALSGIAAVVLGLGVIFLLDRMDSSFRSVDELRAFTHVPVLATIPRIVTRRSKVRRMLTVSIAGVVVSAGLWVLSVGVFRYAQTAEPLTRMLLR